MDSPYRKTDFLQPVAIGPGVTVLVRGYGSRMWSNLLVKNWCCLQKCCNTEKIWYNHSCCEKKTEKDGHNLYGWQQEHFHIRMGIQWTENYQNMPNSSVKSWVWHSTQVMLFHRVRTDQKGNRERVQVFEEQFINLKCYAYKQGEVWGYLNLQINCTRKSSLVSET